MQVTRAQVDRAAEYLKNAKLIDGSVVAEYQGPVNAQITPAGQECVEQGGDVADFLRRDRSVAPSITTNIQNVAANTDLTAMAGFVQIRRMVHVDRPS